MCSFHIFLSIFGCHGNAVCFIENSDSIRLFRGPRKPYYSQLRFLDFLHGTEISATLIDVCLNLVAMVALFSPLKFPIIYVNSLIPNTYLLFTRKNFSVFYTEVKFVQFWLVFVYLVAIAILFVPWKIQTACFNSTTPKPYHIRRNCHYITYRTEICAFLAFLCKFGCYGNSLCSPKIFISIFEFSDPENLTIHANIVSIAFNWTDIWWILVYSCIILVAMATPLALSKIQVAYMNSTTPYLHA